MVVFLWLPHVLCNLPVSRFSEFASTAFVHLLFWLPRIEVSLPTDMYSLYRSITPFMVIDAYSERTI
jgi:hypothetical protein